MTIGKAIRQFEELVSLRGRGCRWFCKPRRVFIAITALERILFRTRSTP